MKMVLLFLQEKSRSPNNMKNSLLRRGLEYSLMGMLVASPFFGDEAYAKSSSSSSSRSTSSSRTSTTRTTKPSSTPKSSPTKSTTSHKTPSKSTTTTPNKTTTPSTPSKTSTPSKSAPTQTTPTKTLPITPPTPSKSSYTQNQTKPYRSDYSHKNSSPSLFSLSHPMNPVYPWSPLHGLFFDNQARNMRPMGYCYLPRTNSIEQTLASGSWDVSTNTAPIKTEPKPTPKGKMTGGTKVLIGLYSILGLGALGGLAYKFRDKLFQ